jgi:N-methylhydantoinase A/oxoprolinase/acetone carboxylase beta subunit
MPVGPVEIGVDIGGTFTDVVWLSDDNTIGLMKIPTTPGDRSLAVREALRRLTADHGIRPADIARFAHGTTVATNAVLERKGARTGLLTTEGFRDVLEIGRQFRSDMYNLNFLPSAPVFLVPGELRKGVRERIAANGDVIIPIDEGSLRSAIQELIDKDVEAIAVAFLFSFVNPEHERRAAALLAELAPNIPVSISSEVDPAFREYERTCVTAFDAYVKPVLRTYIETMENELSALGVPAPLQIMQSRGGLSRADTACERPVRLFLSGPAAGVVGAQTIGSALKISNLITMDVGGTSCDIALIENERPIIRNEGLIDGYTVRVPMVDVNAIGAGGGSIAWIDGAGGLHVGPQSAGSDPGPACYGRNGQKPTVTDASIVLGYIDPAYFANGTVPLYPDAAREVIRANIAEPLGYTVEQAALGIHRILNAQMAEGIRLVSIRRGIDPRDFTLLPLGGGGGLHAAAVADELRIHQIVIPRHPGVLSALGLLSAPIEHEISIGLHEKLADCTVSGLRQRFAELDGRCGALMAREAIMGDLAVIHSADLCFVGQSYYLSVPLVLEGADNLDKVYADFLAAHDKTYGHSVDGAVRVANLRTIHRAQTGARRLDRPYTPSSHDAKKGSRSIIVPQSTRPCDATIWRRDALAVGSIVCGPAILEQADTTTLVGVDWRAVVLPDGSLLLSKETGVSR